LCQPRESRDEAAEKDKTPSGGNDEVTEKQRVPSRSVKEGQDEIVARFLTEVSKDVSHLKIYLRPYCVLSSHV